MSSDQLSAAERSIPPFLITQNPDALADKLLPTLQEPWPAGTEEALARRAKNTAQTIMNGTQLPLLQSPQVVQCPTCHRVLLRDVFEAHQRTCATLPVAELLEAEINFELHGGRSQTKSPLRDQMGGRSSTGVPRRSPVENGVGNIPGLDPVALTNFPPVGGALPAAKRSRSGPSSGSRSGQRKPNPPSAEAEQRRRQFDSGQLTMDSVCGVKAGEKICLRPLNCKYHSVALKRLVDGRTRQFDELLQEYNATAPVVRKGTGAARSGQRKVAGPHLAAAAATAYGGDYGGDNGGDGGYGAGDMELGDMEIEGGTGTGGVGGGMVVGGIVGGMGGGMGDMGVGMGSGGMRGLGGLAGGMGGGMGGGTGGGMGMGGGGLPGYGSVAALRPAAIVDEQWRNEWHALYQTAKASAARANSLDPHSHWPIPLALGRPMRRKRRLQAVPLSALHPTAQPQVLAAGDPNPEVTPEIEPEPRPLDRKSVV